MCDPVTTTCAQAALSFVLICNYSSFSAIVVRTLPGWEIEIQGLQKLDSAYGRPNLIWQAMEDFSSSHIQCARIIIACLKLSKN